MVLFHDVAVGAEQKKVEYGVVRRNMLPTERRPNCSVAGGPVGRAWELGLASGIGEAVGILFFYFAPLKRGAQA
jgi:hypothetical protein